MILKIDNLDLFYGDAQALAGVSLDVAAGELVAIVGANGAGKSSLIRAIAGIETPRAGRIAFRGRDIAGLASYRVCDLGIGQVAEGRQIFPSLTVLENLQMGAMLPRARAPWPTPCARCSPCSRASPSGEGRRQGRCLAARQQMLAIGRCLMGRPADPVRRAVAPPGAHHGAGGLPNRARPQRPRADHRAGRAESVAVSLTLATRAYVLENGRVMLSGSGSGLLADDRVRQAYWASTQGRRRQRADSPGGAGPLTGVGLSLAVY